MWGAGGGNVPARHLTDIQVEDVQTHAAGKHPREMFAQEALTEDEDETETVVKEVKEDLERKEETQPVVTDSNEDTFVNEDLEFRDVTKPVVNDWRKEREVNEDIEFKEVTQPVVNDLSKENEVKEDIYFAEMPQQVVKDSGKMEKVKEVMNFKAVTEPEVKGSRSAEVLNLDPRVEVLQSQAEEKLREMEEKLQRGEVSEGLEMKTKLLRIRLEQFKTVLSSRKSSEDPPKVDEIGVYPATDDSLDSSPKGSSTTPHPHPPPSTHLHSPLVNLESSPSVSNTDPLPDPSLAPQDQHQGLHSSPVNLESSSTAPQPPLATEDQQYGPHSPTVSLAPQIWLPAFSFPALASTGSGGHILELPKPTLLPWLQGPRISGLRVSVPGGSAPMLYCCTVCEELCSLPLQLEDWMRHRATQQHLEAYREVCSRLGLGRVMDATFSHRADLLQVSTISK